MFVLRALSSRAVKFKPSPKPEPYAQQGKERRAELCRKHSEPAAVASKAPASPLLEAAARRNADLADIAEVLTKPRRCSIPALMLAAILSQLAYVWGGWHHTEVHEGI